MRCLRFKIIFAISLAFNGLLIPLVLNEYLRFTYLQTLAQWRAHFIRPRTVFVGDSITAGGRNFNSWFDINLASGGLQTYQIVDLYKKAASLKPQRIVVMAGVNDAIMGPVNSVGLHALWSQMCSDPRVVVTLAPPTGDAQLNQKLTTIAAIVRDDCRARPILDLEALRGRDGLVQPQYTLDGVHLSPAAIRVWRSELAQLGI